MVIDGKSVAVAWWQRIREHVQGLLVRPELHIVLVGADPASQQFVQLKQKQGNQIGIPVIVHTFSDTVTTEELEAWLENWAHEYEGVSAGLVVQLPLLGHIDADRVLEHIPAHADVDMLSPRTISEFVAGNLEGAIPPVAGAIAGLAEVYQVSWRNQSIVLHGHGRLVGRPCGQWLARQGITFSVVDETTDKITRRDQLQKADIIISGTGVPGSLRAAEINPQAAVFDAGTSEQAGRTVGDAEPACLKQARLVTPVPGGVGPMTVVVIFLNLLHLVPELWLDLK